MSRPTRRRLHETGIPDDARRNQWRIEALDNLLTGLGTKPREHELTGVMQLISDIRDAQTALADKLEELELLTLVGS